MAGPEERGGRGAGGSGEAQAQGQPRDSAMAPMQPSLGPSRDEPRVFGLDKFNGDNFAEWSFKMENIFDHYDLQEVMEGTEKCPENDPEKSPWVRKCAQGYLLLGQTLGCSQIRHIKPFQRKLQKGPKAWTALKGVHASATAAVAVVLERQMAALRIEEDEAVEGVHKFFNILTWLEGADLNYRDEGGADLAATTSKEAAGVADTAATTRAMDAVEADSTASATIVTRADICGAIATRTLMDGLLLKAKRVEEHGEGGEEVVEAVAVAEVVLQPSLVKHVTSALGQRAEVKGMGKAMFKGADGKMVGLKNVLWVPNLAANLISVRRLQKAGMDTSSKGAKTYTARLCERILWDLHEDRDVYNEMWQISVVPMPKERQVAASISTKVKNEMVAGIRVKGEPVEVLGCPTCMQAKFTRYPFSSSEATAKAPLDDVVMDVVGPMKLGAAGAEYFLTIVDVYTRMTWVYVLSKMSDVAETVKTDWLPMVERQQDRLVKAIRTDRGGEFLSNEFSLWLKKNGIRHSLTMPYSPAMNGITERANWTITETTRGLLIEAGLPDYFWPDAVRSACVAKNRALTHVGVDKRVPYVEWIGRKPKVDMLRVFGWMCMALVPKHLQHNKLGAKAIWALSSDSTTTRQSSLVNGGEEANDAEEEEEEVQQVSERAPTLPSCTTNAPRIRVTPQQCQGLHVLAAEEEGRGKRRIQAPNRLTYDALGKPAKSALAEAALIVGHDEESDYEECAFAFFSPVEMPGEPATLKQALESSDAEEWKKAMESELKSIEENGTWELVELLKGRKTITSKWLFKIKSDADGKIERYKSRLVAKGYQQKEKVDYKELFAPVGPEEESVGEEERRCFHSLVGSLMYAAVNTRPVVALATGKLARVVQCPNEEQVAAGKRVAKYLAQTLTVGLQYTAAAQMRQKGADGVEPGRLFLTAFSDTSYASEPEDMTSVGGFICGVGGGTNAWESKKQVDQALSSVESKYMALFRAVREIVWQRRLLAELGEEQQGPTPLYCDSQGAIALVKNHVLHGLTKHMRVKWHWTRSMVAAGEVELRYVKRTGQPADMMTKRLVEQ
ncbi:unnamed protein product [Closterium sp. NIES-53]